MIAVVRARESFWPLVHVCVTRIGASGELRLSISDCAKHSPASSRRLGRTDIMTGPPAVAVCANTPDKSTTPRAPSQVARVPWTYDGNGSIEGQLKSLSTGQGRFSLPSCADARTTCYVGKAKSVVHGGALVLPEGRAKRARESPEGGARRDDRKRSSLRRVEALKLEQNLVERHGRRFNVRLRDDNRSRTSRSRSRTNYPRVMSTGGRRHRRGCRLLSARMRTRKKKGVRGRSTCFTAGSLPPPCEGQPAGAKAGIPCFDFHSERCHAPCVGTSRRRTIGDLIDQVIEFLSGRRPAEFAVGREGADAGSSRGRAFRGRGPLTNRLQAIERLPAEKDASARRWDDCST